MSRIRLMTLILAFTNRVFDQHHFGMLDESIV